jgi:hypothetical protein
MALDAILTVFFGRVGARDMSQKSDRDGGGDGGGGVVRVPTCSLLPHYRDSVRMLGKRRLR